MGQSIEPTVVKHFRNILEDTGVRYYEQQTPIGNVTNSIDDALKEADSKSGGNGNNRPDIKFLIEDQYNRRIPVMVEAKGSAGKLKKLSKDNQILGVTYYKSDGSISKVTGKPTHLKGDANYKAVTDYALNGAVHYGNAILDFTDYKEVIVIGVNGSILNTDGTDVEDPECEAYYISERNNRVPKLITSISSNDWSMFKSQNINRLFKILDELNLTDEELEELTRKAETTLEKRIKDIHQKLYDDPDLHDTLSTNEKLYLFCGLIMAGLKTEGCAALDVSRLESNDNFEDNDGTVVITKIKAFLTSKHCTEDKKNMIVDLLQPIFRKSTLWKPQAGESKIKRLFVEIRDNIIPCLESDLHLDFTGKILNSLSDWVSIDNDKKNDVVLTPRYVTRFMAKLCRVNRDSIVWDRAMGSAGFLVSAMDLMIRDAEKNIRDQDELEAKIRNIKERQILGVEILGNIYILAVLNMILMGDGSSNIINGDGHDFVKNGSDFPATVFLLNPPYSHPGKGLNFVQEALDHMTEGYAAILIQENAGGGNGLPYAKNILKNNTLIASIHMGDIFCGKASVQTAIYVFKVAEPHNPRSLVKFIDFSNDGYLRQNRKKSSQEVNLKDVDHAAVRYQEVEDIVLGNMPETSYYTKENGLYIEDKISLEGNDWTFAQHKKVDIEPTRDEFMQTVSNYLSWKVSQVIKGA